MTGMATNNLNLFNPKLWDATAVTAARVLLTIVVAWLVYRLIMRLARIFTSGVAARIHVAEHIRRAETLMRVFRNLVTIVTVLIAGMMVLSQLGISVAPILGAAGVVGLAVGFGAQ